MAEPHARTAETKGHEAAIGPRIRAARRFLGWTLDQLAEFTDLDQGFLSRVERGKTTPSLTSLLRICEVLRLPPADLFAEPQHYLQTVDTAQVSQSSGIVEHALSAPESPILLIQTVAAPGARYADELYTIDTDVEVVHVLRGSLEIDFATSSVVLRATDTLTFPGREPHTWHNPDSDEESESMWTLAANRRRITLG